MGEPRDPDEGLVPSVNEILDEVAAKAGLLPGSLEETFTLGQQETRQIEDGARLCRCPALSTARL